MRHLMFVMAALVLAALAVGCAGGPNVEGEIEGATASVINTHCPMMGSEEVKEGIATEYKGKKIGFCCPRCVRGWNGLSDAERDAKLAEMTR